MPIRIEGWQATDRNMRIRLRCQRQRRQWWRAAEYKQTHIDFFGPKQAAMTVTHAHNNWRAKM